MRKDTVLDKYDIGDGTKWPIYLYIQGLFCPNVIFLRLVLQEVIFTNIFFFEILVKKTSNTLKFMNLTSPMYYYYFLKSNPILNKNAIFYFMVHGNKMDNFAKIRPKIDKGSNFKFWVFTRSFNSPFKRDK